MIRPYASINNLSVRILKNITYKLLDLQFLVVYS